MGCCARAHYRPGGTGTASRSAVGAAPRGASKIVVALRLQQMTQIKAQELKRKTRQEAR